MKKIFYSLLFFSFLISSQVFAQCEDLGVCNSNSGLYSNDDAASIAYDNMGSSFHASYIKEPNGGWKLWGDRMTNNGDFDAYSPIDLVPVNFPNLTGTIYKVGVANVTQLIVLTSTGLFAVGAEGVVLSNDLTTSSDFQKIIVDGNQYGLPSRVTPETVKMLFVSIRTVMITTCNGEVYVLSQYDDVRGDGGTGVETKWSKVMQDADTPLNDVIVARGSGNFGFALKKDGTLWTWGEGTSLGNGTIPFNRSYATQMTLPAGIPGIKMIQGNFSSVFPSYYVLGTDKKIYSLGNNSVGQLGDRTIIDRKSWVNAKNPDDSIITDAAWISANEHHSPNGSFAVIKEGGVLFTCGANPFFMIGRTDVPGENYLYLDIPNGISYSDVITHVEVGGHSTAVIKKGTARYGYVGHRIDGSMGDGTATTEAVKSFDFNSPPAIAVCGNVCESPIITTNSPICKGNEAIFTITGTPGDIVTYSLDEGASNTITINTNGTATVSLANVTTPKTINLSYILGATGSCSNKLSISETITIEEYRTPIFSQVAPICSGENLDPLPTTSTNNITGIWSPTINNAKTTTYTFTPNAGICAYPTSMTINVYKDFDFEFNNYCQSNNFYLEIIPTDNFEYDKANYVWKYNNTVIGNKDVLNVTEYLNSTSIDEKLPLEIELTVSTGCTKVKAISLDDVACSIQKGISPLNNDGKNDYFDLNSLNVKVLTIFNRYGEKVFSKENYTNEWKGQSDEGKNLPAGVYYYVIDIENKLSKTGWIYLQD